MCRLAAENFRLKKANFLHAVGSCNWCKWPASFKSPKTVSGIINYSSIIASSLICLPCKHASYLHCKQVCWFCVQSRMQTAKDALQADSLLVHFDSTKSIVLACDGLGAALSHIMEESDSRKNKFSDVGLHRVLLFNERNTWYLIVNECKPAVAFVLTGGGTAMKDVSQLFLEAIYRRMQSWYLLSSTTSPYAY